MLVWVPAEAVATQAMERLRTGFIEGCQFVAEFDIRDFFGEITMTGCWPRWGSGCRTGGC